MTKTLTEQWRDGELDEGWYYVVREWDDEIRMLYFEGDYFLDTDVPLDNDNIKEVVATVPSYDEYKQLVSKTEQLEKKLKIAMETLQKIADYQTDVLLQYWAEGALNKIKEMEGVK